MNEVDSGREIKTLRERGRERGREAGREGGEEERMKEARDVNSLVSLFQQATIKTTNCKK